MSEPIIPDEGSPDLTETVVKVAVPLAVKIASILGRKLLTYDVFADQEDTVPTVPATRSFVIVGLGRCGCRVTAQLGEMIVEARGLSADIEIERSRDVRGFKSYMRSLLGSSRATETLRLEPIMVIGDLNEASYSEVSGMLSDSTMADQIMKITYKPLAPNGCGNVPPFGEFFTRGLLALPPEDPGVKTAPWRSARDFLLRHCVGRHANIQLAFYVFSAGGGSGAGSAAELLRAQRYAITAQTEYLDPQIYFTGVAVIPDSASENETRLRNTGRTIIQYLGELNLRLDGAGAYADAPEFDAATFLELEEPKERRELLPWYSLGIVSNDIMNVGGDGPEPTAISRAEANANQYIAQQIFNLAAAQSEPDEFQTTDSAPLSVDRMRFLSVHLDTMDLRNGLRGPFAFAFSAATKDELSTTGGIDAMFLRALSLPSVRKSKYETDGVVEGISIAPIEREQYRAVLSKVSDREKSGRRHDGDTQDTDSFSELAALPFFKRCPRMICVLTSPADQEVSQEMLLRVARLTKLTFPNVHQARFATIAGSTSIFTLSMYLEGSVVLCYEVQRSIVNYLWRCWKPRAGSYEEFLSRYNEFVRQVPPVNRDDVVEWLGDRELYGKNIVDFDGSARDHNQRWRRFVEEAQVPDERKEVLSTHAVDDCLLTPDEVFSALRYINYAAHVWNPGPGRPDPTLGE